MAVGGCGRVGFELGPALGDSEWQPDARADADDGATDVRTQDDAPPTAPAPPDQPPPTDADGGSPTADAGSGDPAPSVLPCVDQPGRLFCDDFESDGGDMGRRIFSQRGGIAQIAPEAAHTGDAGFIASAQADADRAVVNLSFQPVGEAEQLFFRGYFLVPAAVTGRINIVQIGSALGSGSMDVNINSDASLDLYFPAPGEAREVSGPAVVPLDEWFCLQLVVDASASSGGGTAWIDGMQVLESERAYSTLPDAGLSTGAVGIDWAENGQGPIDIYVDDVALGDVPIPCSE